MFHIPAAFLEGYQESAEVTVERVDLVDKDIKPCKGCFHCWKSGTGSCIKKDGMEALLPSYASADLVLVNTPLYHFGMTAILKAFFERTLPMYYPYMVKKGELYTHPVRMRINPNQGVGVFATCGFPDAENFRALGAHFAKLCRSRLRFQFFCPEGEFLRIPQLRDVTAPRLEQLREAGRVFAKTGSVPGGSEAAIASPMVDVASFVRVGNASWGVPGELPPTDAAVEGLEPYVPKASSDPSVAASPPSLESREGASRAFALLSGMCALFNAEEGQGLDAVVQFDFSDISESYQLRIAEGRCALERGASSRPRTRIVVPFATWEKISKGELNGQEALMKGAYRVEGDFGLMARLGELFGPSQPKAPKKPNLMALAFVPWYFGWFLGWSFWLGQVLPLALSLGFLAWRESRKEATWFERGTVIAFAFLSTMALAAPASFLGLRSVLCNTVIAAIWGLSLLYGRPLTSDYSRLSVSGKIAQSEIFRKINVRLTALWAVLFGLSAAVGILFAGNGQGTASILTAIGLVPAEIFTIWYPKWYPGHLARRGALRAEIAA